MPVGGSRHYDGAGLGSEAGWKCPACGAVNIGPIAQGCQMCGAGKPGRKLADEPPPPPPQPEPEEGAEQLGTFDSWALAHPQATLEQAFTAGYVEGVRDARRAELARQPPPPELPLDPESKIARTIIAALQFFADQVLVHSPEEIASGEWLSVAEVRALIHQLATTGDAVHA